MIHFVGAGPGAVDLITVRGLSLLKKADVIIYAGSLVNPALLEDAKEGCQIYDSARMTLEELQKQGLGYFTSKRGGKVKGNDLTEGRKGIWGRAGDGSQESRFLLIVQLLHSCCVGSQPPV